MNTMLLVFLISFPNQYHEHVQPKVLMTFQTMGDCEEAKSQLDHKTANTLFRFHCIKANVLKKDFNKKDSDY